MTHAQIRFGRVTADRAVVSVDGAIEALDPAGDARASFEADLVCAVAPQAERDHCIGCGGPLDRYAETRDEFVAGFRITQRVLPPFAMGNYQAQIEVWRRRT